jgi:MFS family permease
MTDSTATMTAQAEAVVRRHAARNFWLNVLDGGTFYLGLSMVSRFTVLPLFVERLSPDRWLQGLIPAINYTGWFLPGLFIVPLIAAMPRRKPILLTATLFERLPFLILGLVLLFWSDLPGASLLAIFFGCYAMHAVAAGFASIPWQDFIARVIPGKRWGIFFGLQSGLGGLLGIGGAAVAAWVLTAFPFPQSVGILSLICFASMVVSFIFLAATVEPALPPQPAQPLTAFLRGVRPLLDRDVPFRNYLIGRVSIALALVGHNFITALALERFNLSGAEVGGFTAALLAAQAISDPILGGVADRWGHKQVLELATAVGLAAILMALVAPAPVWFLVIFVLVGFSQAGYILSGFTLVFSFAPSAQRPAYIGVSNIVMAPIAAAGPLLSGWLAEIAGYETLFVVLLLIGIAGLGWMRLRVPRPTVTASLAEERVG